MFLCGLSVVLQPMTHLKTAKKSHFSDETLPGVQLYIRSVQLFIPTDMTDVWQKSLYGSTIPRIQAVFLDLSSGLRERGRQEGGGCGFNSTVRGRVGKGKKRKVNLSL
jgi:hypothetical protein